MLGQFLRGLQPLDVFRDLYGVRYGIERRWSSGTL